MILTMMINGKEVVFTFEGVPDIMPLLVKITQAGIIDKFEIIFKG